MNDASYTPAAGRFAPTWLYDAGLALLTREKVWRRALLAAIAPRDGDVILDVGCGTGSLAILLKRTAPGVRVVGLDPDPEALAIARTKAEAVGVEIEWRSGFARDAGAAGTFDKVVSSLVFHQVPVAEKRAGIAAMIAAARTGGRVVIADYARQDRWAMRQAFRIVQALDGREHTQPNADGFLEVELAETMGRPVAPASRIDTATGSISIFALDC